MASSMSAAVTATEIAALATRLTGLGTAACAASQGIDQLRALEELKAAVAAAQVRVTAALTADEQRRGKDEQAERVRAGSEGFEAWRARREADRCRPSVGAQVGLARRLSPHQGARQVTIAQALVEDLPATLAALESGLISETRAGIVVRESSSLTAADRRVLDAELCAELDQLACLGDRELTGRVRAIAYWLDAQGAVQRAARAVQERRVSLRPAPDTMAQLSALLPAPGGVAVLHSLQQAAATARAQGDARSRGQVMADTLIERVTGQATADAVPVEVQVVMSDTTLLGNDDNPARIPGYGPLPAGTARDLLAPRNSGPDSPDKLAEQTQVWLRRLFADPTTGALTQVESTRRVFPRGLRRFITTRDQTCRTPWCDAAIRHIDHIHDHAGGGRTSLSNGQGLCERCNYVKQGPGWATQYLPERWGRPHRVRVTTPTGHTYDSTAPPVLPGRRPPPTAPAISHSVLETDYEDLLSA